MATPERIARGNGPQWPPQPVAEVIDLPLRGDFFTPEPGQLLTEMEIVDWHTKKPEDVKGVGQVETAVVDLQDGTEQGSRFVVRQFTPENQKWGLSVDMVLPLAIRVNGFPTYISRKLAEEGVPSRIVGTNQRHGHSLHHDAQATLTILNRTDESETSTVERGESYGMGYSMGSMKWLAMLGLASKMDREVRFTSGIDPCLAQEVDYSDLAKKVPKAAAYVGQEVASFALNTLDEFRKSPVSTVRWLRHMASSVGITTAYAANARDKWDTLATGETGRALVAVPPEAAGIIHFFNQSRCNDDELYKAGLEHTNFQYENEDGLHLAAANQPAVESWVAETKQAMGLLSEGVPAAEIAVALKRPLLSKNR